MTNIIQGKCVNTALSQLEIELNDASIKFPTMELRRIQFNLKERPGGQPCKLGELGVQASLLGRIGNRILCDRVTFTTFFSCCAARSDSHDCV